MELHRPITIIGWGDVPAESRYEVTNDEVLGMIVRNLERFSHLPKGDPEMLKKIKSLTSEAVTNKVGMRNRQYMLDRSSDDLAVIAAKNAIVSAQSNDPNFSAEKIKMVLSGGSSPWNVYSGCATAVQEALGIPDAECFDISAACCSGSQALIVAARTLLIEDADYALVSVGEITGSLIRRNYGGMINEDALLWGDGGGAAVLGIGQTPGVGLLGWKSRGDGSLRETTRSNGLGTDPIHKRLAVFPSMEGHGREIYRWVVGTVSNELKSFLDSHNIKINPRTFLLPHNGNLKMVQAVGQRCGIPPCQVLEQVAIRANQSSASVFSTLARYANLGFFRSGDLLIIATFGGGVIYNFILYRWP